VAIKEHKDSCNSCRFFSYGDRMGICNRYPQAINKANQDWCGEWSISDSEALSEMTRLMTQPVILTEPKKQRGRPKKS